MKKYVKPSIFQMKMEVKYSFLSTSSTEPEVTENIGAKESSFFEFETSNQNLWDDDEDCE